MMDSQNNKQNSWNEWANYVLHIINKHDKSISEVSEKIKEGEICSNKKLNQSDFEKFLKEDYIIFKTKLLTQASIYGSVAGLIVGTIVSIIITILEEFILK